MSADKLNGSQNIYLSKVEFVSGYISFKLSFDKTTGVLNIVKEYDRNNPERSVREIDLSEISINPSGYWEAAIRTWEKRTRDKFKPYKQQYGKQEFTKEAFQHQLDMELD